MKKNTKLGTLDPINSITPLPVKKREIEIKNTGDDRQNYEEQSEKNLKSDDEHHNQRNKDKKRIKKILQELDLSDLNYEQRLQVEV